MSLRSSRSLCLKKASSSKSILASAANILPSSVKTSGLISTSEQSLSRNTWYRFAIIVDKGRTNFGPISSPNAILRPWKGRSPSTGSTFSRSNNSGVFSATSSISIPPAALAMTTTPCAAPSITSPRYSSRLTSIASSTKTLFTGAPSGPVWNVTRVVPRRAFAASSASCGMETTLIPPALPRPPAWTWALTTTLRPSRVATARASSEVVATPPSGTATPPLPSISFAWYSWIFK